MKTSLLRFLQSLVLCLLLLFGFRHVNLQYSERTHSLAPRHEIPRYKEIIPRLGKISMLYGEPNRLYQRAVASHERHASIHGYPLHILRKQVARGYWNKPSYLISVLLRELEKDPGDRLEWLMWFDADSVVMNLDLPAELFLPPNDREFNKAFDHKHLLVTKDWNGLNTGIFFIRVHEWSVQFMAKTLAYSMYNPDVHLGYSADQRAMALIINETEFRQNTTFLPRTWINTYVNEAQPGHLLVHFAGLIDRDWYMKHWLSLAEGTSRKDWIMPAEETKFTSEILRFWTRLRTCEVLGDEIVHRVGGQGPVSREMNDTLSYFNDACWYRSDEFEVHLKTNQNPDHDAALSLAVQMSSYG